MGLASFNRARKAEKESKKMVVEVEPVQKKAEIKRRSYTKRSK